MVYASSILGKKVAAGMNHIGCDDINKQRWGEPKVTYSKCEKKKTQHDFITL